MEKVYRENALAGGPNRRSCARLFSSNEQEETGHMQPVEPPEAVLSSYTRTATRRKPDPAVVSGEDASLTRPGVVAVPTRALLATPRPPPPPRATQELPQQEVISAAVVEGRDAIMLRIQQLEEQQDRLTAEKLQLEEMQGHMEQQQEETTPTTITALAEKIEDEPHQRKHLCLWAAILALFVSLVAGAVAVGVFVASNHYSSAPVATMAPAESTTLDLPPPNPPTVPPSSPTGAPYTPPTAAGATPNRSEIVLQYLLPQYYNKMTNLSTSVQRALEWLSQDDDDTSVIDIDGQVQVDLLLERFALAKFYYDMNGLYWRRKTNWLSHSHGICNWLGLTCDYHGHLQAVQAAEGNLHGELPTEIGLLTRLEYANLSDNNIQGTIPTEIGFMVNLESLEVYTNALTGQIPTQIGHLHRLSYVDLDENCLAGTFPTELARLTHLNDLYISTNLITGNLNPIICDNREQFPMPPYMIMDCNLEEVTCDCCQICCNHVECVGDRWRYEVYKSGQCWGS